MALRFLLKILLVFVVIPFLWAYAWHLFNAWYLLPLLRNSDWSPGKLIGLFDALVFEGVIMCGFGVSIFVGCGTSFSGFGVEEVAVTRTIRDMFGHDNDGIVTTSETAEVGLKRPRGSLVGLILIVTGVFMIIRVFYPI